MLATVHTSHYIPWPGTMNLASGMTNWKIASATPDLVALWWNNKHSHFSTSSTLLSWSADRIPPCSKQWYAKHYDYNDSAYAHVMRVCVCMHKVYWTYSCISLLFTVLPCLPKTCVYYYTMLCLDNNIIYVRLAFRHTYTHTHYRSRHTPSIIIL